MPQQQNRNIPPPPGLEWDPTKPGQFRKIQGKQIQQFQSPQLKGVTLGFDPTSPTQAAAAIKLGQQPLDNVVKMTLKGGREIGVRLDTPAKVARHQEFLWDEANRERVSGEKADDRSRQLRKEASGSIFDLIDRINETQDDLPTHTPEQIEGMGRLLQTRLNDYQKLVGTSSLSTTGGPALPGMKLNPYIVSTKEQTEILGKTDWFQTPDGKVRLNDPSGNATLPDPNAPLNIEQSVTVKAAGAPPLKKPKAKKAADDKKVAPGLKKIERKKLIVKIGRLKKELRTAVDSAKPKLRKEIERLKAEIKELGG